MIEIGEPRIELKEMEFWNAEVKLLGHLVSKQGILPYPKKVDSIQKLQPPKDVTKVKSFLGWQTILESLSPNF